MSDYWGDCGQVFFCNGKGYGLADDLQTICLGDEDDIKKFFEDGELNDKLMQKQLLSKILEYRKEEGIGNIRATSVERTVSPRRTWYRKKSVRPIKKRQRTSVR